VNRGHYLPATARSISISLNGGVPQYLNAPSTLLYLDAPPGADTFAIAAYDEHDGHGNVVAAGNVTQNVVTGGNNLISATLDGVVASLAIALGNSHPNAGVPATTSVNVTALDADGNVIVGSTSDYSTPIKLSINDATRSGTMTLSKTLLQGPWATATLSYNGGTLLSGFPGSPIASVVASATGIAAVDAGFAPRATFYQYSIPVPANRPQFIASGSDGNMYFTENPGNAIARITPAGVVTEFPVPTANSGPTCIINASDGDLWFTELTAGKIAKMTTTGSFTEYSTLFAPPPNDDPYGLVDRGDGSVWYVANGSSRIGFQGITSGVAGETSIPTSNAAPFGIATAPDNNLYYTESAVDKIGRTANLFATQSEVSLTAGTVPEGIVRGPDGNVWFAENGRNMIGRLSPSSFSVTGEFPTLTPNSEPTSLVLGHDSAIWFTETGLDRIGRITTSGAMSEFISPVTGLGLRGIAVARDGSIWFAELGTGLNPGRVGKLVY
jgi:virginiamycin B lyase